TYSITVPSTAPWTDTGIMVPANSLLGITATGVVRYGTMSPDQVGDANGTNFDGQQFFSTAVLPNATIISLIGKIGGTTNVGDGTPVPEGKPGNGAGYVGAAYSEVISSSGELFLGYNDQVPLFGDNSGSFSVTVSITPIITLGLAAPPLSTNSLNLNLQGPI